MLQRLTASSGLRQSLNSPSSTCTTVPCCPYTHLAYWHPAVAFLLFVVLMSYVCSAHFVPPFPCTESALCFLHIPYIFPGHMHARCPSFLHSFLIALMYFYKTFHCILMRVKRECSLNVLDFPKSKQCRQLSEMASFLAEPKAFAMPSHSLLYSLL